MNTAKIFITISLSLFLYSCSSSNDENLSELEETTTQSQPELANGFLLAENNCFSCHSPNASIQNEIAPTMGAIKRSYVGNNISLEQFTKDLITFLNDPSEKKSKMPEAVKEFNLMPKMSFNEAQITEIAKYLYHSSIEKPDWYAKQYQEDKQNYTSSTYVSPLEEGLNIAIKTKGVLGKNLLGALNSKGTEHALSFCSTRAITLTDSMSVLQNAKVKRVSDKNRNPNNGANEAEIAYINATKSAISKGEKPQPKLTTNGNKHVGYYPIMMDKMCLQCHGVSKKEVLPSTLSKIQLLYPNDKAIDYKINELRGVWVVEMDKK